METNSVGKAKQEVSLLFITCNCVGLHPDWFRNGNVCLELYFVEIQIAEFGQTDLTFCSFILDSVRFLVFCTKTKNGTLIASVCIDLAHFYLIIFDKENLNLVYLMSVSSYTLECHP